MPAMKAYGKFLIIEPLKVKSTEGGIILPDTIESAAHYGRVHSAGEKAIEEGGEPIAAGDVIIFFHENTVPIPTAPGQASVLRVLASESVVAVLEEGDDALEKLEETIEHLQRPRPRPVTAQPVMIMQQPMPINKMPRR